MKNRKPAPRTLDLTGTACPLNFVKIKLELDGLPRGTKLEVTLDCGQTAREVRQSLKLQGYEVLSFDDRGRTAIIVVSEPA
ncbi:MAG TPA: sulfurtransferase TusA family protein [Candidatus Glassbacteria bacterium]|nr:sulfurtransferase TusA family protein [Candidatus Glassbacteria bacterium]